MKNFLLKIFKNYPCKCTCFRQCDYLNVNVFFNENYYKHFNESFDLRKCTCFEYYFNCHLWICSYLEVQLTRNVSLSRELCLDLQSFCKFPIVLCAFTVYAICRSTFKGHTYIGQYNCRSNKVPHIKLKEKACKKDVLQKCSYQQKRVI